MREAELKNTEIVKEGGLADMADMAERDPEVQMARAELYKIAKNTLSNSHEMLKGVSEAQGMEGWQQSQNYPKAQTILVLNHPAMDYDMKFETKNEAKSKRSKSM